MLFKIQLIAQNKPDLETHCINYLFNNFISKINEHYFTLNLSYVCKSWENAIEMFIKVNHKLDVLKCELYSGFQWFIDSTT